MWPGKPFVLAMEIIDELNHSASGFAQLYAISENNQVQVTIIIIISV